MKNEISLAGHDIFVAKARLVCQQSLFFLSMLHKTNWQRTDKAAEEYRSFALDQIKSLIRSIYIPKHCDQISSDNADIKIKNAAEFCKAWKEFSKYLDNNPDLPMAKISEVREKILALIEKSKADSIWHRYYQQLFHEILYYLRKKIAFFWSCTLLIFLFSFEAIWGLLRNEGWGVIVPLILVLLPLIINRSIIEILFSKNATVAFWDIGGRGLRKIIPLTVEPGRLVARWPTDSSLLRYIFWSQAGRLAVYIIWWSVTIFILKNTGGTLKTTYAFLSIGCLILTLANLLDLWDFMSKAPFRFLVLLAATIFIIFMLTGTSRLIVTIYFVALALISGIVWLNSRRMTNLASMAAMVFCAVFALIGGITQNAEIWRQTEENTAQQRLPERLDWDDWPHGSDQNYPVVVMAASGGGSRAAVFAGLTLQRMNQDPALKEVVENLQAISSVSGGSLANAAYIARLLSVYNKLGKKDYASARRDALPDLTDALKTDFLWPTLLGVFEPFKTRGKAIEEEWERGNVKLGELRIGSLIEKWREDKSKKSSIAPFPIPLFNAASLEGHDVVITPLARELYTDNSLYAHAASDQNYYLDIRRLIEKECDQPTWVFYRNGIYGLENLLPNFNPLLSSAVRASANFPFGFPLVRIVPDPAKSFYFSPVQKKELVALTDGGALSNSGMWSLFHLLINGKSKLVERGVLLIIVDAGKMPIYRNLQKRINALVGSIQDQSTIGQNMHRLMYDILQREYHHRIGIVKFDIIELESYNVMTTWALDDDSLATLHASFDKRWEKKKKEILKKWQHLRSRSSDEDGQLIDRRRPPMD